MPPFRCLHVHPAIISPLLPTVASLLLVVSSCSHPSPPAVEMKESLLEQLSQVQAGHRDFIAMAGDVVDDNTIEALRGVPGIHRVVIEQSRLSAAGLEVLATIPGLEHLVIRGRAVDDEGLSRLATARTLTVLNLPQTTVSDAALRELQRLPELMLLRIGSPNLQDECLEVITGMPALKFLHLIDVPVSDQGLRHLHGFKQLESLYLDGAQVSGDGVAELMKELPRLHLHLDQHHHDRDPSRHDHPDQSNRGPAAPGALYCGPVT
ncbi:MAG: hypothetical protein VYB09_08295 [Planctomycetota bacterium]|nr:hypothetical protein [Planctomycetota bacterium]